MEAKNETGKVLLSLNSDEVLVLLEWLSRFNREEHQELFRDQAEERVLFDLEAALEGTATETLKVNYKDILLKAWESIRDKE